MLKLREALLSTPSDPPAPWALVDKTSVFDSATDGIGENALVLLAEWLLTVVNGEGVTSHEFNELGTFPALELDVELIA